MNVIGKYIGSTHQNAWTKARNRSWQIQLSLLLFLIGLFAIGMGSYLSWENSTLAFFAGLAILGLIIRLIKPISKYILYVWLLPLIFVGGIFSFILLALIYFSIFLVIGKFRPRQKSGWRPSSRVSNFDQQF